MIIKKRSVKDLKKAIFGFFFVIMGIFTGVTGPLINTNTAYAVDETIQTTETTEVNIDTTEDKEEQKKEGKTEDSDKKEGTSCKDSLGSTGWLVCPTTEKIAEAVDWLYDKLQGILTINPVSAEDGSPIYEIWKYCLGITNIIFIIFLLVVVYSQLTGVGITNYGIKKVLPKLIVAAILVNLSFLICSLAVDVSNILGNGIRGLFASVQESVTVNSISVNGASYAGMGGALAGGGLLAIAGGIIAFETGVIWMLIPTVLGAIVAVATGLITIALRQAVVVLLIMIAPLAIVAYILPNTEQWFKKWKQLFIKMLVFYPMFSLLFGASSLAGFAIIASGADSGFNLLLGIAVQIFPLFFSWKLMQMSGTVLGTINTKMQSLAAKPLAANRAWADSRRQLSKQQHLASNRAYTPSLRLMQFMSDRRIAREAELSEHQETVKNRGLAYKANRNYNKRTGAPTRRGERAYAEQADNMEYQRDIAKNKNTLNKGFGYLAADGTRKRARLDKLDARNVMASDNLFAETARGEKIEYDNAMGRHQRFEDAINAHFDSENGNDKKYKIHDIKDRAAAEARYAELSHIAEGEIAGIHYAAATAAQAYDTQKKIVETKMQKYFELTPPTKDVEHRLGELTKVNVLNGEKAVDNIDLIIPGLRILNQRGDTDLLKHQMDNVLDKNIGGGMQLGTHASQSLASFLMFEVKDNDPFLRRFGKYINLETANAYNENKRKVMDITYDEYIRGYHDGEVDLINDNNKTGRMYAKKDMKKLVEGTSLDNIERTALSNLDESLKHAYGFRKDEKGNVVSPWNVKEYLHKREDIQTAFEPAFLSAALKWLSGSEQMNSGVKFWTGYELKQKTDENGNIITDKYGDPEYDLTPVWEKEGEFIGKEKDENGEERTVDYKGDVEEYYRDRTKAYIKDQTTGQILGMRTDFRDAIFEHFASMYLDDSSDALPSDRRKLDYERTAAEIQSRYGDKDQKEAKELRDKDMKALKAKMASIQIKKVLGETGKLEQIYRTRRSGAANNAKDWWRNCIGLDDEIAINAYLDKIDKQRKEEYKKAAAADGDSVVAGGFDDGDRAYFKAQVRNIYDSWSSFGEDRFYEESVKWVKVNLKSASVLILKLYEEYHEANPNVDDYDLMEYLQKLLQDPNNY